MAQDDIKVARLRKSDMSLREVYRRSRAYYKLKSGDDKKRRYKMDIVNAKLIFRNNFEYNRSTKEWEQTGREVKFVFIVKSDPESYPRRDNIPKHTYPVTILLRDVSMGIDSPFRWRTGSLKRPKFPRRSSRDESDPRKKKSIIEENKRIQESNIRRGVQMQFFFELEWILDKYNLLFGPNYAAWPPRITNPRNHVFWDKHFLFLYIHILHPLLTNEKVITQLKSVRNPYK